MTLTTSCVGVFYWVFFTPDASGQNKERPPDIRCKKKKKKTNIQNQGVYLYTQISFIIEFLFWKDPGAELKAVPQGKQGRLAQEKGD